MLCVSGGGMLITRALAYASLLLLRLLLLLSLSALTHVLPAAGSVESLLLEASCSILRYRAPRPHVLSVAMKVCKVLVLLCPAGVFGKLCMVDVGRLLPPRTISRAHTALGIQCMLPVGCRQQMHNKMDCKARQRYQYICAALHDSSNVTAQVAM
jgi:hypothetical protein